MTFSYDYARPALTVDCVVFGLDDEEQELKVLLIQRDIEPFAGQWALPGGFVNVGEAVDDAARRELTEETGLKRVFLEQLYTFGKPDRDPREHVVTVAYYALVRLSDHRVQAATDARNAGWFAIDDVPKLAFDHQAILKKAHERLQSKVRYQPIGFELLPSQSFRCEHFSTFTKSFWNERWISETSARKSSAWMCWKNWTKSNPTCLTEPRSCIDSINENTTVW